MKRSSTRWRRGFSALALAAALCAGCVTQGTYREAVEERDTLRSEKATLMRRVHHLEASTQNLDSERVELIAELEELRERQERLKAEYERLKQAEAELSMSLEEREAALARRTREIDRLRSTYEGLVADLESEVAEGQIQIEQLRDGLRMNLTQEVLFPSGSAQVNRGGRAVLAKVAERVKDLPHRVVVVGHTDNVPIQSARYPSNWELAGARASGVIRILEERGVDPTRMQAVSRGEWEPLASNDTAEGRRKNRRIEITLQPVTAPAALDETSAAP